VEAVIGEQEEVKEVAVVAREGEGGEVRVVAYVVWRGGVDGKEEEVRRRMSERLPEYMMPSEMVSMQKLPLTENGKVDRRALPLPKTKRPNLKEQYTPPATDLEMTLANIWRDVLQIERVGVHDNFFDLGGHSLRLVRVHRKMHEVINKDVSLMDLFRFPTIAALATHLLEGQVVESSVAEGVKRGNIRKASRKRRGITTQSSGLKSHQKE
jgi:aryl carrier-like protein